MEEIGLRIKELRQSRGISQLQLAEALGVHQTMISAIERGSVSPSMKLFLALQDFFGVTLTAPRPSTPESAITQHA